MLLVRLIKLCDVILRKSSETAGMCVGCIHQDVKIQDTSMKLNNKFNKLNETCDKQDTILRKLRAEVKLLRKWAKLKKLTPPSPPASPTPRNVHIELALDSKYGHFKLKREQPQQLKTYGAKKRKDEANGFDNMETAGSAFGSTIDLLAIEGELKSENLIYTNLPFLQITKLDLHTFSGSG